MACASPCLFSVLIDTYNYSQFISEAIESALQQDFPQDSYEIIVVDDGSTDDTPQIIREKYSHLVKYVYKTNEGQASAFNRGFEESKGELICFLDGDDFWHPTKLSTLWKIYKEFKIGCFYHDLLLVDSPAPWRTVLRLSPFSSLEQLTQDAYLLPLSKADLLFSFAVPTSGITLHRSVAQKIFPLAKVSYKLNADFFLQALGLAFSPFVVIRSPLGSYRCHPQGWGLSLSFTQEGYKGQIEIAEKVKSALLQGEELPAALRCLIQTVEEEIAFRQFLLELYSLPKWRAFCQSCLYLSKEKTLFSFCRKIVYFLRLLLGDSLFLEGHKIYKNWFCPPSSSSRDNPLEKGQKKLD
ncbi:glycosyltransferase family 2 protein [Candidatus Methylacidiphilum infernorum]|uniref:glycosyltransferase family 2 protein n=1 Tax=Candidatus Methylacidiphilum infernorum TaxID=511746 RepID=UPI0002DB6DFC|nr:glycosyltransferase family 2 protein [Candidatus Methylacidiphilum infernorum]